MTKRPWEKSSLEVTIENVYEAEVVGEEDEKYSIEFFDEEARIVEAQVLKKEFENFPYSITEGSSFGIVSYIENGDVKVGSWPTEEYWNPDLK